MEFPANPDVPNAYGVSRNQARDDVLPLLRDLAKLVNNVGVQMAGPSSNPVQRRDMDRIRAQYEARNITAPRINAVIAFLEENP